VSEHLGFEIVCPNNHNQRSNGFDQECRRLGIGSRFRARIKGPRYRKFGSRHRCMHPSLIARRKVVQRSRAKDRAFISLQKGTPPRDPLPAYNASP
jgi:hypothetical protein